MLFRELPVLGRSWIDTYLRFGVFFLGFGVLWFVLLVLYLFVRWGMGGFFAGLYYALSILSASFLPFNLGEGVRKYHWRLCGGISVFLKRWTFF